MSLITNIILSIPIGLSYNFIIHKLCDSLSVNLSYSQKIQNNLIIILTFSIIAFVIAYYSNKNKSLKYGLYFGASLLFLHSIIYNWHSMNTDTKMILTFFCFICLIWYSFTLTKNNHNDDDDDDESIDDDDTEQNEFDDNNDLENDKFTKINEINLINFPDDYIEKTML